MDAKVSVSLTSLIDQTVVPGDVVLDFSNMTHQRIKLGSGLRQDGDAISAMRAGKLSYSKPDNGYWLESSHKRYIPRSEDTVLGIVVDSIKDIFLVDVKGPQLLFFPKPTKQTKLEVGALLYLRVVKTNMGMNCTNANGKDEEFGLLKDGFMFETSTGLPRILKLKIAVGLNGRVWVKADAPRTVITVANAIMNSESLNGTQQRIMVDQLLSKISD